MVRLVWQDRFGHDKFAKARSFDISESGLRIEMPEPLQERSYVTIKAEKLGLHGQASVRHCSKHGTKYIVGLEFAAGLRWKPPTPEIEEALQKADALLVSR